MGSGLSLSSRTEITKRYAEAYVKASKKDKGRVLDAVIEVTGWSRDNARRRLVATARSWPRSAPKRPRPRPRRYSYDALRLLQRVWAVSGQQCGKYLVVSMPALLDGLERHGELSLDGRGLFDSEGRYSPTVRAELLAMSPATIDRYLKPVRDKDQLTGISGTKPSPLLRSSVTLRKAGDEVEAEPGFFEVDTVYHCGPTMRGEFARTVNLTCVHTGWVFTRTVRNNAHAHVLATLKEAVDEVPFAITGLDFDNGGEFLNWPVIGWAGDRGIYFTRSRPYKKNDQATIESKNGHLVRKYGFYYRYDTAEERQTLNRLWRLVNDRFNYLTPTKKPTGWGTDRNGRRKRLYDKPKTPLDRLIAAKVLSAAQETQLTAYRDSLNPVLTARQIAELQARLVVLAKDKTDQLRRPKGDTLLTELRKGIRVRPTG
jgi:hypothetical protein